MPTLKDAGAISARHWQRKAAIHATVARGAAARCIAWSSSGHCKQALYFQGEAAWAAAVARGHLYSLLVNRED